MNYEAYVNNVIESGQNIFSVTFDGRGNYVVLFKSYSFTEPGRVIPQEARIIQIDHPIGGSPTHVKVNIGEYFVFIRTYSDQTPPDISSLVLTEFYGSATKRELLLQNTSSLYYFTYSDDVNRYRVRVKPNSAPSTPTTITLPSTVYGGKSCSVSWSKSTDEDGNLEGYIVERSYNGGSSWSQIYQGTATSTSTTIPFGTSTVMFRVCAYDTEGEKSGWRTSSNKTVINNRAPGAPPSISVPLAPSGGEALTVTWTAASDADSNLEGYELERQWDGTGAFTQLYKGAALSYRDSIPKGEHTSVIYRVRAYDAMGAKSSYTTSPSRTIENNTAPVIISDLSGDLGVKSDGFTIPYTITDAEQQAVTVTEAVGSLIKRSYQPTLGEQNTFEVTGEYFQKILNGANTVTITAQDTGGKSSVLSLTFTKKVHKAVITLTEPLPSEQQIEVCVLSITGEIPADADCLIEVTNNGADEEPVWEDATADVKAGRNHVFTNKMQTNGWAFNFRVTAERGQAGESETSGYIMSIQGGFQ